MELDLQNLLGLHVHSCTHWPRPRNPSPLPPPHLRSYTRAVLVSQDRRHLCELLSIPKQIINGVGPLLSSYVYIQRVLLNDLWRTRRSRRPIIWLHPHPYPHSSVSKLDRRHLGDSLLTGEGKGKGGGAKSYDGEKAWSSINHSILSAWNWGGGITWVEGANVKCTFATHFVQYSNEKEITKLRWNSRIFLPQLH
jgi:hypothetical protein